MIIVNTFDNNVAKNKFAIFVTYNYLLMLGFV